MGVFEVERNERDRPRQYFQFVAGEANAWKPGELTCFRHVADLQNEMLAAGGPGLLTSKTPESEARGARAADEVVWKDRHCPQWSEYESGISPSEHLAEAKRRALEKDRREFQRNLANFEARQADRERREDRRLTKAAIWLASIIGLAQLIASLLTMSGDSIAYSWLRAMLASPSRFSHSFTRSVDPTLAMSTTEWLLHLADTWKPLAEWLTGIGTVGTVIVAMWLARRDATLRLHITTDLLLEFADDGQPVLAVACAVQNRGDREATLIDYGYQLWPWRSSPIMIQGLPGTRGTLAGARLRHGDSARCVHPLDAFLRLLHDDGLTASPWRIWRLRMHVRTSFGDVVRRRIGPRLRKELLAREKPGNSVARGGDSSTLP